MTKSRKGTNPTLGRGKTATLGRPSTKKPAAGKQVFSDPRNPLHVLFDDVLSGHTKREGIEERRKRQSALPKVSPLAIEAPVRVALYIRVSGDKSVVSDLSMPDQEIQLRQYCDQQGWLIAAVYYEPGKSAKSTARRQFRRMIYDASCEGEPPFNKILTHNLSRFARSSKDFDICEALMNQRGIEILAITQTFAKDAGGLVAKKFTTLMDEYYSFRASVDSKRTRRHMVDRGFWPGGVPPYGYKCTRSREFPQRSVLEIDQEERVLVEKVYSLAVYGDGSGPPLGVKSIVRWLNHRGYRTRTGSTWSIQGIHRILTHSVYYGDYFWGVNQTSHSFQEKFDAVLLKVSPIISRADFDKAQEMLKRRNPRMSGAKLISSSLLLSGIARCACGASMTLGTGTGKLGKVYRYYICSSDNRGTNLLASGVAGENVCSRPRVGEGVLDAVVLEQVRDQVFSQDRLLELLNRLRDREMVANAQESGLVPKLKARITAAETALSGLIAIAKQVPTISEQPPYREELTAVSMELKNANQMLSDLLRRNSDHAGDITPERVELFRSEMLDLLFGENRAIAKVYLSTIVAAVIVGNNSIDIQGHISDLATGVDQASRNRLEPSRSGVRRYVRRWRRGWDTNMHSLSFRIAPYLSELQCN